MQSQVFGPTIPSATKPFSVCHFLTTASVPAPKIPSALTSRNSCSSLTAFPLLPFLNTIILLHFFYLYIIYLYFRDFSIAFLTADANAVLLNGKFSSCKSMNVALTVDLALPSTSIILPSI